MKNLKLMGIYSGIVGFLYLAYGIGEAYSWIFGPFDGLLAPSPDIMGAFILILIGSILLYRINRLMEMKYEGLAFLFVGLVLSAIIGIMYMLMAAADAADAAITGEPWEFSSEAYNIPAMLLFMASLPLWIVMRHREEFRE